MSNLERRLNAFVRAALVSLGPVTRVRRVPLSAGGSNTVLRVRVGGRDVVLKLRADRADDATREAWALGLLPRGLGPQLLLHSSARALVAQAMAQRDVGRATRLDVPVGGVLVMEALPGRQPVALDHAALGRVATALRQLHAVRTRGPTLHVGRTIGAAVRTAQQLAQELKQRDALPKDATRAVAALLRAAATEALRPGPAPLSRLCHGDLRLHNLMDDGVRVRLLDLEHAGVGDPLADLLLFACRTPLSRFQELTLLDALPLSAAELDAYFQRKPLFRVLSALAAAHDLSNVARQERPVARAVADHLRDRLGAAEQELTELLGRRVRTTLPAAAPAPRRAGHTVIAIDGTASSGKSVVAHGIARALGLRHVNTGLYFRAAALLTLEDGLDERRLRAARMRTVDGTSIEVDGRLLDLSLQVLEIERLVAKVAQMAFVRTVLRDKVFREVGGGGCVVEGRGIGMHWFPDARAALFVDARAEVRARRLWQRLAPGPSLRSVAALLRARDVHDATRALEPNRAAGNAHRLDTSRSSEATAVGTALRLITRDP